MRRRPARVRGFFAATNGGKNLDFLRDLLEGSLLRQTENGFEDSLLDRSWIVTFQTEPLPLFPISSNREKVDLWGISRNLGRAASTAVAFEGG